MKYFLLSILVSINMSLFASHIVGGDIYYDYLGNNQYRFFITVYRDCNSTGAAFDDPLSLAVYNTMPSGQQAFVQEVFVPFPGSVNLPIIFNNPCVVPPTNICVERAIYITVLTLPPTSGGYTVAYQRCCRGPNITNLVSPDDTGLTLAATIPGTLQHIGKIVAHVLPIILPCYYVTMMIWYLTIQRRILMAINWFIH